MFVLQHVIGYGGSYLFSIAILPKVVHKISLGAHQIHDDGVINLEKQQAECVRYKTMHYKYHTLNYTL